MCYHKPEDKKVKEKTMKGIKKVFALGCAAVVASCGIVLSACGEEDVEKFISEAYAAY